MIYGNLMENIGHGYLDPILLIKLETMDKKELHLQLIFLVLVDAVSWIDSNNNLWLFGGDGYDSVGD